MKHFVLTRFNEYFPDVVTSYWKSSNNPNLGIDNLWLKRRLKIFFNATFPTLKNQSNKNFTWIIKCHYQTPNWARNELKNIEKEIKVIIDYEKFQLDKYKEKAMKNSLFECRFPSNRLICKFAFENHLKDEKEIITSRVDSDDAVAFNFIQKVQENIRYNTFIDFDGAILIKNKIYEWRRKHKNSPCQFCSYKEKIFQKNPKTVYFLDHTEANPCDYLNDIGWLQINHDMCLNNNNIRPIEFKELENWKNIFIGLKNVVS